MRDGQTYHETETFDRQPAATAWMKQRERELAKPGVIDSVKSADPTLSQLARLIGLPTAPAIIGVRADVDVSADPRFLPGADHRDAKVKSWINEFAGRNVVAIRASWDCAEGRRGYEPPNSFMMWRAATRELLTGRRQLRPSGCATSLSSFCFSRCVSLLRCSSVSWPLPIARNPLFGS